MARDLLRLWRHPSPENCMRGSWFLVSLMAVTACSSDRTDPGIPPDVPAELTSTTLDGAIALFWTDNSFTSDPSNFSNYRIYSTSYDLVADLCGSSWGLEGTTVAAEFVAGALANGTTRCFAVSAVSLDGAESARSQVRLDTPRPDSRNVALFARQVQDEESGFRFWLDSDGDGRAEDNEFGIVGLGSSSSIDFSVERDEITGMLFLAPVRPGTGVEFYDADTPVEDLTSIDFAADVTYLTTPIEAAPGFGYVFEMDGGDGLARYGAVRVTHVGETFLILDWAFQTDPGNPELLVVKKTSVN